ncbi:hypothetical protein [Polynucleobacter asymbioticus]|uniref:Glucosamine inositolphosphorylceramide transferase 1 N-terminal domain-containing protein n=1 Tax=Polynucleobacter asymbioticus TaxID=576611 RepID=A0AAC9ITF7_9BURK|nr:hypothetical protein [Polynucleobacter asymbioticus]APB98200.1 hypothetical protein A4F89_02035 [Polynucleobacter asymbioticus]APC00486.1 hypothetical protein AOC25_02040 [Polynucleobacter asymbioticus]
MLSSWKKWFAQEQWTIGLVNQSLEDIVNNGIIKPIEWLPALKSGFLADPHALILPDGRVEILAERFDFKHFKGEIVCATTPLQEVESAHFKPAVDLATHLSYPQRISWGKREILFCESWESNGIPIFSRADPCLPWTYQTSILQGQRVVDPTPFFHEGIWYLFYTLQNDRPNECLRVAYSTNLLQGWTQHTQSIIQSSKMGARPAGPICKLADGRLIRPGQDCSSTYGGAIALYEIIELTISTYREELIRVIEPQVGNWQSGLHTICGLGNQHTLVDGKRWLYSLLEIFRKLARQRMLKKRCKQNLKGFNSPASCATYKYFQHTKKCKE